MDPKIFPLMSESECFIHVPTDVTVAIIKPTDVIVTLNEYTRR